MSSIKFIGDYIGWSLGVLFVLYLAYEWFTYKPKPLPVLEVGKATVTFSTDGKTYTREFVGRARWNDAFGNVSWTAEGLAREFIACPDPIKMDDVFIPRHHVGRYKLALEPFSIQAERS